MRSDDVCRTCGQPVRAAIRQVDCAAVFLDSRAVVGAQVGVVAWQNTTQAQWRTPIVSIVGTDARTETPMRYTIHECEQPSQ